MLSPVLLLLRVYLFFACRGALAANVESQLNAAGGDLTTLNTVIAPAWADSANVRGTADILWSCIVTLTACVYTAMHLNIPAKHRSNWRQLRGKIKWAVIALLAPELVLHTALKQYITARKLCNSLNAIRNGSSESKDRADAVEKGQPVHRERHFDLAYGFWVVMGGFVVETGDIHDTYSRLTLGPQGVELLAREGLFLEMPDEMISARSKGNLLAKALVCTQVGWMVVQCIARKAASYPLTLLELHTMVHVVCALSIYSLWWHKPLDVEEATVVDASTQRDLIALMVMESRPLRNWKNWPFQESASVQMYPREAPLQRHTPRRHPDSPTVIQHWKFTEDISEKNSQRKGNKVVTVRTGEALECGLGPYMNSEVARVHEPTQGIQLDLSKKDVQRWELVATAVRKLDAPLERAAIYSTWQWMGTRYRGCERGLNPSAPNIITEWRPHEGLYWMVDDIVTAMMSEGGFFLTGFLLPIVYGGVHLSAWNFEFASYPESLIWKIACIGIMGAVPFQFTVNTVKIATPIGACGLARFLCNSAFWLTALFYAFGRTYIVLEAFLSLRSVPLGAYAAVPWVQSIPHL